MRVCHWYTGNSLSPNPPLPHAQDPSKRGTAAQVAQLLRRLHDSQRRAYVDTHVSSSSYDRHVSFST
jgi:hypothetical protein